MPLLVNNLALRDGILKFQRPECAILLADVLIMCLRTVVLEAVDIYTKCKI